VGECLELPSGENWRLEIAVTHTDERECSNQTMPDDRFTASEWWRLVLSVAWLVLFVSWPQLVFAATLLLIGGGFIAYNAVNFWTTIILREPSSSVLPIFGGIIAAAGIGILPVTGSWNWAWIPLLLDWGGLPMVLRAWWEAHRK